MILLITTKLGHNNSKKLIIFYSYVKYVFQRKTENIQNEKVKHFCKDSIFKDACYHFYKNIFNGWMQFFRILLYHPKIHFLIKVIHESLTILTLFQAGSGITIPGRYGQILPTSSLGYINLLNDLIMHKIYSQVDILDFSSP